MIRLWIIKPDESRFEITLFDTQPMMENIDRNILLFENYVYRIEIESDKVYENVELYVGDYQLSLSYNEEKDIYETLKENLFIECFDLVDITVCLVEFSGMESCLYTNYLRIATTKQTSEQTEMMLKEIENAVPNFLDICFSRSKKESGLEKNRVRSIWSTIKLLDEIIDVYEQNYGSFRNYKRTKIIDVPMIVDAKAMRRIDQEGLQWISRNPDYLHISEKGVGIEIGKSRYLPSKVKTYINDYSYEIYENRVVLGFLREILNYIDYQIFELKKEIDLVKNVPYEIIKQIPNTHELTGRCIFVYYQGVVNKFKEKAELILDLYYRYSQMLMCTPMEITYIPELTNTFKQVYHYSVCYECIVKWYETGDYSFDHVNYLFKLKTLSRIFEYYCLIKFQYAILLSGYELKEALRIEYDELKNDDEDINNKYLFSNGKYEITLFYEPFIHTKKINKDINIYSTGYNFSKAKWNQGWTPDFVFKICGDKKEYYFIIDAKFSKFNNVKKRYIPELVLKYLTQIASYDKYYSDVIGVGAIYPNDNNKLYYYKKESNLSEKKSIPIIFSLSVEGEEKGNIELKNRMLELLDVVDILENNVSKRKEKREEVILKEETKSSIVEYSNSETEEKNIEQKSVNGKKCHYFSKGRCLIKKTHCKVQNDVCYEYKYKDDTLLKNNIDSCRFYKREKRRTSCSITNRNGCIGADICKFYQKKNKQI